jgi:AcrR family transcriptional regulator
VAFLGAASITERAAPELSTRQGELLDAFEALILAEGFRHLTVGAIAERLGCSRRTLYELAPSKDELVALAVRRHLARLVDDGLAATARHRSPARRLEAVAELVADRFAALSPAFTADVVATPRTAELVGEFARRFADDLAEVVAAGVDAGQFRRVHPRLVAEAILGLVDRLQDPAVLADLGLSPSEAARQVARLFLDGIRLR